MHIGCIGTGEPPENGEMTMMRLPCRHRIRNSSPGNLRSSTLPSCHGGSPQYGIIASERGRNILFSLKLKDQSGVRARNLSFNHCTRLEEYAYTLNNIGSSEGTLQFYYHKTPGGFSWVCMVIVMKGSF